MSVLCELCLERPKGEEGFTKLTRGHKFHTKFVTPYLYSKAAPTCLVCSCDVTPEALSNLVRFTIPRATVHVTLSGEEGEGQGFSGHSDVSLLRNIPTSDPVYDGDGEDNDGNTQERRPLDTVVGGDRETLCSIEILRRGLMYEAAVGIGAASGMAVVRWVPHMGGLNFQ